MSRFHRILVAIDFSEQSDAALRRATAIARDAKAVLHLVHAYEVPFASASPYGIEVAADLLDSVRDAGARRLEKDRAALKAAGLECQVHLPAAPASSAIVETASAVDADLIVMGTHGLGGLQHVLLGSTAERTVRLAPCPVLTVKAGVSANEPFANILVPVDFSSHTEAALAMAIDLAKESKGHVHLLHVYELPTAATTYGVPLPSSVCTDIEAAVEMRMLQLGDRLKSGGIPFTQETATAPVSDAILSAARTLGTDLIVMGTRGRTGLKHVFLGSVAERTLRHAGCPVLTLNAREKSTTG